MAKFSKPQIKDLVDAVNDLASLLPTAVETGPADLSSQPGAPGGPPLDQFIDASIGRILGARPSKDPNRIVSLLTGAFEVKRNGANSYYTWRQRGVTPADNSTPEQIAGRQATLYQEVLVIQTSANRLLDSVEPIILDPDEGEIEDAKGRIRNSLAAIVSEFGRADGAVLPRIDSLLDTLSSDLDDLKLKLGLDVTDQNLLKVLDIATIEQIQANFETLKNYIGEDPTSLLQKLVATLRVPENLKGTALARLLRTIDAIPQTVQVIYEVMDSVRFGSVDRRITKVDNNDTTTFEQLFSWIETSASNDWPTTLVGGGAKQIELLAVRLEAEKQRDKIIRLLNSDLSEIEVGKKRVITVLDELRRELQEVVSATSELAGALFVKEVDPPSGQVTTNFPAAITGFNFGTQRDVKKKHIKVKFGVQDAKIKGLIGSNGLQTLNVVVPTSAVGIVNVSVENSRTGSDTLVDGFTYE